MAFNKFSFYRLGIFALILSMLGGSVFSMASMPVFGESVATTTSVVTKATKIILDGKELVSPEKTIFVNNRLMLPMNVIFTALDATLTWNAETRVVYAVKNDIKIQLKIGSSVAMVNGKTMTLDAPPVIVNSRTFVPVRFIAETLGLTVTWDSVNRIANLESSLYMAQGHMLKIGTTELEIGLSETEVIKRLGAPVRKDPSEKGFLWFIYNKDYSKYVQVGIKNGIVVALYTNAKNFSYNSKVQQGMTETSFTNNYKNTAVPWSGTRVTTVNGSEITTFFDLEDGKKLTAILLMAFETTRIETSKVMVGTYQTQVFRANELQLMDLSNAIRNRLGLKAFLWDEKIAAVARKHSLDMATNGYFDHINLSGQSPFDRIKAAGINFSVAAENIAAGYPSAIVVHQAWMNSPGHRQNVLADIKYFGAGITVGPSKPTYYYYSENFYTPQ